MRLYGKSVELNSFGTTYVDRTIVLAASVDMAQATGVRYDPATGAFSFVPTVFEKQTDGTTKVTFRQNGNGIYAVLASTRTFGDIGSHWAKPSQPSSRRQTPHGPKPWSC